MEEADLPEVTLAHNRDWAAVRQLSSGCLGEDHSRFKEEKVQVP